MSGSAGNAATLYSNTGVPISTTAPMPSLFTRPTGAVNAVLSRTEIANGLIQGLNTPVQWVSLIFIVKVTAVSGAGATMTITLGSQLSDGLYTNALGGSTPSITAIGEYIIGINRSSNGANISLTPTYQISWVITGTTPSFTFFIDRVSG